jgi:type I restriction enzyme S subunit
MKSMAADRPSMTAQRSKDADMNEWLAFILRAKARAILLENRKEGTTVQSIRYEQLKRMQIPVPPLPEQRRILKRVETLLVEVNAARDRLAKVPAILKRFRQAVLAAACDGRLTEDWRALRATGAQQVTLTSDDADEVHDDLPELWRSVPFGDITRNFDGKRVPVKSDDRKTRRGDYPYYGASGVIDAIDAYLFDGDFLLVGEDGAISSLEARQSRSAPAVSSGLTITHTWFKH